MDPALRASATGMKAQQTRVEVISNNLANVNTTAFKRSRAHFEDLLYQTVEDDRTVRRSDSEYLPAVQIGRGTRLASVLRTDSQGPIQQTGRPLDLAIEGDGFLQVRMPDGSTAYTRDGTLGVSDQGVVVTQSGYTVLPPITVPPEATELTISTSGVLSARTADSVEPLELGRIELARFSNPPGLRALGENLYAESPSSGRPIAGMPQEGGFGRIIQGSLEGSNVEIVQEMVEMITALRSYEINSKAIQSSEEMSQIANNLIR